MTELFKSKIDFVFHNTYLQYARVDKLVAPGPRTLSEDYMSVVYQHCVFSYSTTEEEKIPSPYIFVKTNLFIWFVYLK